MNTARTFSGGGVSRTGNRLRPRSREWEGPSQRLGGIGPKARSSGYGRPRHRRVYGVMSALFILLMAAPARADEGMWMVNAISRALVDKMQDKGLTLNENDIYDASAVSIKDAIVSLDFGCTGSFISHDGLLITNHHCAYSDVHALSTPEHNYLEDGFSARSRAEEIYIPGKSVQLLERILDVTDEVNELIRTEKEEGRNIGSRRVSYLIEKRYTESTGFMAILSSMWAGSRYYLSLYRVFTDVRLVAAPPVSVAAFGGDIDNWEWPQHKCDFALYRVYGAPDGSPAPHSPDNVPLAPRKWLEISTNGYKPGDFTMVLGYPGRTDRYTSAAKMEYRLDTALPITNSVRGDQMEIINRWMNADPEIRLKYSDQYFMLSNVQENNEGLSQCCKRFKVLKQLRARERKMKDDKALIEELDKKYAAIAGAEKDLIWFRETLVRGSRLGTIALRISNGRAANPRDLTKDYQAIDLRVEKDLIAYALRKFYENVSPEMWGPFQTETYRKFTSAGITDWDALLESVWTDERLKPGSPLVRLLTETKIGDYNHKVDSLQEGRNVAAAGSEFTRALYNWRLDHGELQYPDANSTMRMTYGTVGTFRRNCRKLPWQTYSKEILAKENDTYDFSLKDDWRALLQASDPVPVDFITDNDITGGNSGSPVLNARGELIGLAFDGNKESLAGDVSWTEGYNKCVCADIRFVLLTLKEYMHLDYLTKEITLK